MIRSFWFATVVSALALSAPTLAMFWDEQPVAVAQEQEPAPAAGEENEEDQCFNVYPFGRLKLTLENPVLGSRVFPGDVVNVGGTIDNPTHAQLPAARLLVRILREDETVAEEHWHPVVDEFVIEGINVPAATATENGLTSFSGEWHVPAFAPAGMYRAEISLLAADGSPIAGVPYVPNVFAAMSTFTVEDGGQSAAVEFDRSGVLFNGAPFVFRAVPPRPETGPLTIDMPLTTVGNRAVGVTVDTALYEWTDVEGGTVVSHETEEVVVSPGESLPVSFSWPEPQPGVYELVVKAQPLDSSVLPSVIHVRFYYEGTVPRILHAGLRYEEDGSATIAGCFFNSTFGPEGGSGTVRIEREGTVLQEVAVEDLTIKKVAFLTLSAAEVLKGFAVVAEAKDLNGVVTDTERVEFPGEATTSMPAIETVVSEQPWWVMVGGVLVVIFLILTLVVLKRRGRIYTEPKEQTL